MDFEDKNYGIWLLVKPSVGIPLFFIGIAVTSLLIHFAVLTHTTWMSSYWQGHPRSYSSEMVPAPTGAPQPALASK